MGASALEVRPASAAQASGCASPDLDVRAFGAVGDGIADDSAAFISAAQCANVLSRQGRAPEIYFPAGVYLVAKGAPLFYGNVSLRGDGPYRSYLKIDPRLSGDIFSWSDTWMASMTGRESTIAIGSQKYGVRVEGLSIVGDTDAPQQQNAFTFYDRADNLLFRDVTVYYLHGRCLTLGVRLKQVRAYARESQFFNLQCRNTGTASAPAMDITSAGDGDGTNSLYFYDTKIIFPAGIGLRIANSATRSSTRNLYFSGLMVHGLQEPAPPRTGDLVVIGGEQPVNNITMDGFTGNASYTGSFTVRIVADEPRSMPFNISISGTITSGANGIAVDAGRSVRLKFLDIAVNGPAIKVGPKGMTGPFITLDMNGREDSIAIDVDPTALGNLRVVPTAPYVPPRF